MTTFFLLLGVADMTQDQTGRKKHQKTKQAVKARPGEVARKNGEPYSITNESEKAPGGPA